MSQFKLNMRKYYKVVKFLKENGYELQPSFGQTPPPIYSSESANDIHQKILGYADYHRIDLDKDIDFSDFWVNVEDLPR